MLRGRAIQTHTSSGFRKQTRSHGYNNSSGTTGVQHHQWFKLWPLRQPRVYCVRMCVQCSPEDTRKHDDFSKCSAKIKHTSSNFILLYSSIQQYSEQIGTSHDDAPCLQLATLPGFQVNHIPKGGLVVYMTCESTATATKCPRGTS